MTICPVKPTGYSLQKDDNISIENPKSAKDDVSMKRDMNINVNNQDM